MAATLGPSAFERDADSHAADVAVGRCPSPFGDLLIGASDAGVLRIAFAHEDPGIVIEELVRTLGPRVAEDSTILRNAVKQLGEYFSGRRRSFDLPLDLRLIRGFRREVVAQLADIPFGERASYGQVAEMVGNPLAARAVGSACANNPVPIILPCHRVVKADGSIGNYGGGVDFKRYLLNLEEASPCQ